MAKKYREKTCNEVEAVQWTGKNTSEVLNFTIKNCNGAEKQCSYLSLSSLFIMKPGGDVKVSRNDYIVKGTDGEFYVCERNVFEAVYEEVEEPKSALKKIEAAIIGLQSIIDNNDGDKSVQSMIYEHMASKAIAEREFTKRYRDIADLYERLAKGGIECTITIADDKNVCTIYNPGIELDDSGKRINKSFEDVLEEEE